MKRRRFASACAAALALAASGAHAQPAGGVFRIGYFGGGLAPADRLPPAALRNALRDLGYVEGRNVGYVSRWADLKFERLAPLAQELAEQNPSVIVAIGYPAADAARQATRTIPIVVTSAGDPAAMGLVVSLARPGANVTGISDQSAELSAKRMELLKEVRPGASRIAVLWNVRNQSMTHRFREIERAADALRISVQPLAVAEPKDFDDAFAAMARQRPDALLVVTDALTRSNQGRVIEFAAKNEVPTIYEDGGIVRSGGLISYGPKSDELLARTAGLRRPHPQGRAARRPPGGAADAVRARDQPAHGEGIWGSPCRIRCSCAPTR